MAEIRHYKLNASGGYEGWSKVARAPDCRMHVPARGFDATGHDEVREIIFGWLNDIGAEQALVDIVEVFQIDDEGIVAEIMGAVESLAQKSPLA